jgi:hypothetical protein
MSAEAGYLACRNIPGILVHAAHRHPDRCNRSREEACILRSADALLTHCTVLVHPLARSRVAASDRRVVCLEEIRWIYS